MGQDRNDIIMAGMYLLYLKKIVKSQECPWIKGPMIKINTCDFSDFYPPMVYWESM